MDKIKYITIVIGTIITGLLTIIPGLIVSLFGRLFNIPVVFQETIVIAVCFIFYSIINIIIVIIIYALCNNLGLTLVIGILLASILELKTFIKTFNEMRDQ